MIKINKEKENYYKNFLTIRISQEINDYEDHFAIFTSLYKIKNSVKMK